MPDFLMNIQDKAMGYVPIVLKAVIVLAIGLIAAWLISLVVQWILRRTHLHKKINESLDANSGSGMSLQADDISRWIGIGVFVFVGLYALIPFFSELGFGYLSRPLQNILDQFTGFLPSLIGAVLLGVIAWVIATVLRLGTITGLQMAKLDKQLQKKTGTSSKHALPFSKMIGNVVYYVTLFLFLPVILELLQLNKTLEPVQNMIDEVLNILPNILAAAGILIVGYLVARLIQKLTENVLAAVGADQLAVRIGLGDVMGKERLSHLLGVVVHILVLLPVLVAALNTLGLEAVTSPVSNILYQILDAIPALLAAALILIISYVVGKILSQMLTSILKGVGFDRLILHIAGSKKAGKGVTPSEVAGHLALALILVLATIEAAESLNFELLASILTTFLAFAAQIFLGLVIFALGYYLSNIIARTVKGSGAEHAKILSETARFGIIILAGFMALDQMGIANSTVNLAFTMILGGIAVACALAFGLGGRDAAKKFLDKKFK